MHLLLPLVLQSSFKKQTQVTMKRQTEKMNWWRHSSLLVFAVTLSHFVCLSSFLSISWWQEEVFKLSSSTWQEPRESLLVFSLRPSFCDVLVVVICFVSLVSCLSRVFMSEWDMNWSLVMKTFPPSFLSFSLVRQSRENIMLLFMCRLLFRTLYCSVEKQVTINNKRKETMKSRREWSVRRLQWSRERQ